MKNRINKYLSLLIVVFMIISLLPVSAFAAGSSVTVDIIVAKYDSDWEILYPTGTETTSVTVTSQSGAPTLLDAMKQLDLDAALDSSGSISTFFKNQSDWDMYGDVWICEVAESTISNLNTADKLSNGDKILFGYCDLMSYYGYGDDDIDTKWDTLSALITPIDPGTPGQGTGGTITVNAIVALNGYDGWQILYPNATEVTTVTVSYEGANAVVFDVAKAIDPNYEVYNTTGVGTLLGQTRGTNGGGNWNFAKRTGSTGSLSRVTGSYAANEVEDGSYVVFYCASSSSAPQWDTLETLIANPNPTLTPEERLENLLTTELTFDKIKGNNTAADNITANLGSLPGFLDGSSSSFANISVSWVSGNPLYISNSGTLQLRPRPGEQPVNVTMTATAKIGGSYTAAKYGDNPNLPQDIAIDLTILPFTADEWAAKEASEKAAVDQALSQFEFKYLNNETCGENILKSIWLNTSSLGGVSGVSAVWTSSNQDVIKVSSAQGLVTRPALGQPDATVTLTVTAYKNQYGDSKQFVVTVPAVTQQELDAANAELDAAAAALTFDLIKNANTSADAVTSNLQMYYRATGYPGGFTWGTSNSGYDGVMIEWSRSDGVSYGFGTVTPRPTDADRHLILTAKLTLFQLETHLTPRTVDIPIIVRKVSHSADVASITASPSMGLAFDKATKSYNLTAPAIADSVSITVTTEETGALITAGQNSARGILTFDVTLSAGVNTVIINTQGLDTPANTDSYTLNITRETASGNDAEVTEILNALTAHFANTSDDWAAVSMSAHGKGSETAGGTIIENARNAYIKASTTELDRKIIALTALGVKASHVYAGEQFADDYIDFVAKVGANWSVMLTTEAIFGLIALDSGEYDDDSLSLKRKDYIDYLLTNKLTPAEGQTAWSMAAGNTSADVDITAMALAALAPYYLDTSLYSEKSSEIRAAVDEALVWLSSKQNSSGHFGNSNSTSMVIVALAALGIDPNAAAGDFAKEGKSLIDGLLAFKTSSNLFGNENGETANAMSTEQGFRALTAYRGFKYAGETAYNVYSFGPQTGDGTDLTGENNPDNEPPDPSAPKSITVRVENMKDGTTLMPKTTVNVAGTHLDALKAALAANGHNPETALSGTGFITSILGVSSSGTTGWMYTLNGRVPSTTLTETRVVQDDTIVMFYIDYNEQFYIAKFDKNAASAKTGEAVTVTLTGSLVDIWSMADNPYEPVSGATVYAYSPGGATVTSAVTGADGKATLNFVTAGTYTISAKRTGDNNATDLVPPLCEVTITAPSTPGGPGEGDSITAYFTLRGLNSANDSEQTWISNKAVANIAQGSMVSDVIVMALQGTGYTQYGAEAGYITVVTTPDGFALTEMYKGLTYSGWLFKVNSQLPTVGMNSYTVQNGDSILLYFTKDYTKDPDAGTVTGGGSPTGGGGDEKTEEPKEPESTTPAAPTVTEKVEVAVTVDNSGTAKANVKAEDMAAALENVLKSVSDSKAEGKTNTVGELKLDLKSGEGTSAKSAEVAIPAAAVKTVAEAKDVALTVETDTATVTLDASTLAGIAAGAAEGDAVTLSVSQVDKETALNDRQKEVVGDNPVIELTLTVGENSVRNFDGTVTVTMPYSPPAGVSSDDTELLTVYYLDADGNIKEMKGASYDPQTKSITFTTKHFSTFFVAEWVNPFNDISKDDWFYRAVRYVYSRSLMNGITEQSFEPGVNMTRAMLVTILYRHEGSPKVGAENRFSDVAAGQWYTDAVIWASENGIVSGYGDGLFGTDDMVTREQLVTILKNYTVNKNGSVSKSAELKEFTDTDEISAWALEAMKWANAEGLIQGRSENSLAPKGSATRAETASILMRYISAA